MWIWLILAVLIAFIVLVCQSKSIKEPFMTIPREINAVCIYAAHNIDSEDVEFILKYVKDIPFHVINNGSLTAVSEKLNGNDNIHIHPRPNVGYDAGAWKYAINNIDLTPYDIIVFMNNSCIFGCDLLRLCEHGIDYDLYSYGFSYELFKQPYDDPHLHAYMFFVNKRLFNHPLFKKFWDSIDETSCDHDSSVKTLEYHLKSYFEGHNFKVGSYLFFDVDDTYNYQYNTQFNAENIKKREVRAYPEKLEVWRRGQVTNKENSYILNVNEKR